MKFSLKFCKSEKKVTRYDHKCTLGFIKVPLIVVRYWWHLKIFDRFSKNKREYHFHENPSRWNAVVPCGRTVMRKLIVAIRNYTNAPTIYVYARRLCTSTKVKSMSVQTKLNEICYIHLKVRPIFAHHQDKIGLYNILKTLFLTEQLWTCEWPQIGRKMELYVTNRI